ncbi:MAG: hypothetical protein PHT95_06840 [Candidatus Omnitrophica bacterium]|nr:hypothetical protein [Candidatus Omnitrophota bacterium]
MGIDPVTLGVAALVGGGLWGASEISKAQERKEAKSAAAAAQPKDIGNLTKEEAGTSASKKMFREGLYFTSPTGLSSGGTRGRSRLFGA